MPSFKGQISDDDIGQLLHLHPAAERPVARDRALVPDPNGQVLKTQKATVRIEVVASGLDTPWGEAFLPDGSQCW